MLEIFGKRFDVTDGIPGSPESVGNNVAYLFGRYGGCTLNGGLYRVHGASSSKAASVMIREAYPELYFPIVPFGFDWLGRQFILDLRRPEKDPEMLCLEPGTGWILEIPIPFSSFHDSELVQDPDGSLLTTFFSDWRKKNPEDLQFDECAGYTVPLFLGGADEVHNLELSNIEVYWSVTGQLRTATKDLPRGAHVDGVQIGD
ncbi:T6SS immunity protein Tdi1 domain-containing protein [Paenarthrobacter sp. 2TAF44]|uniref:T6SS immunity protein Tdi1 domain-containing protein n=1 Tax=Paenarthrobacter sp. 2TAF44 TaxID=3233018 RepID=UPI003F9841ED